MVETEGAYNCHSIEGKSAELGCYQYQQPTWEYYANIVLGYVPPRTYINERYVAVQMIQRWLNQGYTPYEIGLKWNGGEAKEKSGVNRYGQKFDTAVYGRKLLAYLNQ